MGCHVSVAAAFRMHSSGWSACKRGGDEGAYLHLILGTGNRFDTTGDINGMGMHPGNGFGDIFGGEAAGQNYPLLGMVSDELRGQTPIDHVTAPSIGA